MSGFNTYFNFPSKPVGNNEATDEAPNLGRRIMGDDLQLLGENIIAAVNAITGNSDFAILDGVVGPDGSGNYTEGIVMIYGMPYYFGGGNLLNKYLIPSTGVGGQPPILVEPKLYSDETTTAPTIRVYIAIINNTAVSGSSPQIVGPMFNYRIDLSTLKTEIITEQGRAQGVEGELNDAIEYESGTARPEAIAAAILAEVTNRNIAITSAVSAEATSRIDADLIRFSARNTYSATLGAGDNTNPPADISYHNLTASLSTDSGDTVCNYKLNEDAVNAFLKINLTYTTTSGSGALIFELKNSDGTKVIKTINQGVPGPGSTSGIYTIKVEQVSVDTNLYNVQTITIV
jgi:hypothetical protein